MPYYFLLIASLFSINLNSAVEPIRTVVGNCYDIETNAIIKCGFSVLDEKGNFGEKSATADTNFSFVLDGRSKFVVFESEGFRSHKVPINVIGDINTASKFFVSVPMIKVQRPQIVRQEKKSAQNSGEQGVQVSFEIYDGLNMMPVMATVCLNSQSKENCFDHDYKKAPIASRMNPDENNIYNIESPGFELVTGDIAVGSVDMNEIKYTVYLLRPTNQLSVYFSASDSVAMFGAMIDKSRNKLPNNFPVVRRKNIPTIRVDNVEPGAYEFSMSDGASEVIHKDVMLKPGFNFIAVQDRSQNKILTDSIRESTKVPEMNISQSTDRAGIGETKTISFDSANLYFDRSSYTLKSESKATLDSIGGFMTTRVNIKAHITGYTDNIGKRELNMTLSEYRARAVVKYLREKGVKASQMVFDWKGPDSPNATSGDKGRNQRVEIRFNDM